MEWVVLMQALQTKFQYMFTFKTWYLFLFKFMAVWLNILCQFLLTFTIQI